MITFYNCTYVHASGSNALFIKFSCLVFLDNDFEVFTDPDGSTHFYKEFEINAINTTWDLELNKVCSVHVFYGSMLVMF